MGQMRKRHAAGAFKTHIKRGDQVVVLAGKNSGGALDRGERGRVISVDPQRERAVVEGVNLATKHQKPQQQGRTAAAQQQGGRIEKAAPIHISNLQVLCPGCGKPTRVAHREVEGKSVRACKHCNETLDRAE